MVGSSRQGRFLVWIAAALGVMLILFATWKAMKVDHLAAGHSEHSFLVDCDFGKFRQIMVRKNATNAIVSHSGMKLIDEKIEGIELDMSADNRPLLNAIRGKSKTELSATRVLTVQLVNTEIDTDQVVLNQNADIQENRIQVRTVSSGPSGQLEFYETTLDALPDQQGTRVTLTVDIKVLVQVLLLFTGIADQRVQAAADEAVHEQATAMAQFVSEHASDLIIVPEISR